MGSECGKIYSWDSEVERERVAEGTRKILSMNGAFHTRSSVDRLYIKRKEGGRGLISVEECVRAEEAGRESMCLRARDGCSRL